METNRQGGILEEVTYSYQVYWYDSVCGFWAGSFMRGTPIKSEAFEKAEDLKAQGYRVQFVTTTTEEF